MAGIILPYYARLIALAGFLGLVAFTQSGRCLEKAKMPIFADALGILYLPYNQMAHFSLVNQGTTDLRVKIGFVDARQGMLVFLYPDQVLPTESRLGFTAAVAEDSASPPSQNQNVNLISDFIEQARQAADRAAVAAISAENAAQAAKQPIAKAQAAANRAETAAMRAEKAAEEVCASM